MNHEDWCAHRWNTHAPCDCKDFEKAMGDAIPDPKTRDTLESIHRERVNAGNEAHALADTQPFDTLAYLSKKDWPDDVEDPTSLNGLGLDDVSDTFGDHTDRVQLQMDDDQDNA